MACPEITGRRRTSSEKQPRKKQPVVLVANTAAYNIREYCEAHRISERMFTNCEPRALARARRARSASHHHSGSGGRLAPAARG